MRKELRFSSNAPVYLIDKSKKEVKAYLRDLSLKGLSIKSDEFIDVEPNSPYEIAIVPEDDTDIVKIQLEIKSRWVKIVKSQTESGFSITMPSANAEYEGYIEHLAMRGKVEALPDIKEKE